MNKENIISFEPKYNIFLLSLSRNKIDLFTSWYTTTEEFDFKFKEINREYIPDPLLQYVFIHDKIIEDKFDPSIHLTDDF